MRGVQYARTRYQEAADNIERQWAFRGCDDTMKKFKKEDFPDLISLEKPAPLETLAHAIGCFNTAMLFSNYEKADKYFQILIEVMEMRDKSLEDPGDG